jgi:alpha-glucosidase (family GH31 glycosyl hydrolase)
METHYLSSAATRIRVQSLAANAVRITHLPRGSKSAPPERPWLEHVLLPPADSHRRTGGETSGRQQKADSSADPASARCCLTVDVRDGCVRVSTCDGQAVLSEARPARQDAAGRVYLALRIAADEGFYGWGEWFNDFRREKGTVRLWSRESPAVLQSRQTYSNIPFFLSSHGYGLFLLNSHESVWHILREQGVLEIGAVGPPADYVVIYGPAFRDILSAYTALTGRPPLVPRWAFGLWVTEYPQENQEEALKLVEEHRRRSIPLDAVILDYHWEERFHNLHWRQSLFPAPDELLARLRDLEVKLGLIFTPFLNSRNGGLQKGLINSLFHNVPAGRERDDERALPQYEEAKSRGYLAHPQARWWFGSGGMIDFTNPAAANWWNALLRPLYEQGVAFFKNDDGEYLPTDARSALGMDGPEYHNLYGFFYGKAIYEGMAALDERRPLIYARSVWAGSQRYPAIFLGDQKPTFDHMRATIRAGLNMSLMGFAYWTADVFGLDGETTPETHMRYAQWALLAPIARYFWRPPQVDGTRFPWSHGPEVEANFRRYTELRYRLLPYYCVLAWEAYRTGLPILRPLVLEFPDDPRAAAVADQVLLGDRLMVAPVVQPGATSRRIYLPARGWHDFWSTQSYAGGREIEYAAPLDRLPILVRGSTVLPMGPVLQHIPDDHRFDPVQFHIWPPHPAAGLLYEDDGRTRDYQSGAYSIVRVATQEQGNTLTVCIAAAEGEFAEHMQTRQVEVILHRAAVPAQVRINGQESNTWNYDSAEGHLCISLQCPIHRETIVEVTRAP